MRTICPILPWRVAVCLVALTAAFALPPRGRAALLPKISGQDKESLDAPTKFDRPDLSATDPELLQSVVEMVDRGNRYLIEHQNRDGSFSIDPDDPAESAPIAVTSLVCLSFMSGGITPERGRYKRQLRDGLSYLCKTCNERGEFVDDRDNTSKMHGQGFAILALAQAYGMYGISDRSVDRNRLAEVLRKSVALVEEIQSEVGGWSYEAKKASDHEGSITICVIQALRAARNTGIHVERQVVDKAVRYVHRSQKKSDGSFRYMLNHDHTSFALTAAAVATLNATGDYDSGVIDLAMDYMLKKDPVLHLLTAYKDQYPQYARFYAAQAYYEYKDRSRFDRWYPKLVEELSVAQRKDGAFPNADFGPIYATAMTLLTLQIPFGYLPIFQR